MAKSWYLPLLARVKGHVLCLLGIVSFREVRLTLGCV